MISEVIAEQFWKALSPIVSIPLFSVNAVIFVQLLKAYEPIFLIDAGVLKSFSNLHSAKEYDPMSDTVPLSGIEETEVL